jgi:hypothetical protein
MHSFFTIISQRARVTGDAIAKFCLTMIVYAYKLMPYLVRELSCLFVTITPTVIHDDGNENGRSVGTIRVPLKEQQRNVMSRAMMKHNNHNEPQKTCVSMMSLS